MTLTEKDHLEAIRNQLQRQADALQARLDQINKRGRDRIARIREEVNAIDKVRQHYAEGPSDVDKLLMLDDVDLGQEQPASGKVPISESVDKFIEETGRDAFTAADVLHYLQGLGYEGKWLYGSIYESLTRRVKSGKLAKADGKFKLINKEG